MKHDHHFVKTIAQGGMARIDLVLARPSSDFEKLVVLKRLKPGLADDPTYLRMFADEVRITARLDHPNVVQTHSVRTEGEEVLLAMEYLEGVPYARLTRGDGAPVPLVVHLRVLADALNGLHHAHELCDFDGTPLDIVHCDVSPQNVFVTFRGSIKVIDFGIATGRLAAASSSRSLRGKLSYMAPEQLLRLPFDRRADVFCVGIMLWEALTGRRLWSTSRLGTAEALRSHPIACVRALRPEVPAELAAICARALARDPAERFATAAEMSEALEGHMASSAASTSAREVGRLAAQRFGGEHASLRALIEQEVLRVREGAAASLDTTVSLGDLELAPCVDSPAVEGVLPLFGPGASRASCDGWERMTAPAAPRVAPARRLAGVLLTCAALGWLAGQASRPLAPSVRVAAASPPASAEAITTSTPATPPEPPAPNEPSPAPSVRVSIRASDPRAVIRLDGVVLGTGSYAGDQPRDDAVHLVTAEAPGFAAITEGVVFEEPVALVVPLRPTAPPKHDNPLPANPYR